MQVLRTIGELRSVRKNMKGKVGFVPTMGALHEGHMTLVKEARKKSDHVIVSIFVNPTQFGPSEDYASYPRTEEADRKLCEEAGVDVVFYPAVKDIYPKEPCVSVKICDTASKMLCGKDRPGHFSGVAQVVAILLNIVHPDIAVFGEKDFQQLMIVKRLVSDLHFPVEIVAVPLVREKDGLAMSSRNRYLSYEERKKVPAIYVALTVAKERAAQARFDRMAIPAEYLESEIKKRIEKEIPEARVEYVEIRNSETLERSQFVNNMSRVFVAVHIGKTRLIDTLSLGD